MSETIKQARRKALRLMLRPITRFWLQGSETIQDFIDVLKGVFVEIAQEELENRQERINVSRLSVMTGVHRPDVTKFLKQEAPPKLLPDVLSRVVGQWEQNPKFTTKAGKPRVISFEGPNSEFAELVASVSRGIAPGTALFKLEQTGAVEQTKRGLKLLRPTLRHTKDMAQGFQMLAEDMETLAEAVQQNLRSVEETTSPNVHMRTEYDNVFVKDLPEIRSWLRDRNKRLHKETRNYLSKFDKDVSELSPRGEPDEKAGGVVVLGSFSFIDKE